MTSTTYGEKPVWGLGRPHIGPVRLLLSWVLSTVALLVACWIVPGASVESFGAAFVAAAVIAVLNAILPPVIAALKLPLMLVLGLLLVLIADSLMLLAADNFTNGKLSIDSFGAALLVALVASAVSVVLDVMLRDERRRRLHAAGDAPHRASVRGTRVESDVPGIVLPRDRRARPAGAASGDARRQRADDGALARRRVPPAGRVGDGPLLADRRLAGGHPPRLERGHPRLPLGREGDGAVDGLLCAAGLRGDRATARRAAGSSRDGGASRGNLLSGEADHVHPHGQPDGGGEEGEPGLPGLPRQRVQRDADARPAFWEVMLELIAPRHARSAATCARAGTVAATTRCCGPRSAWSSAT